MTKKSIFTLTILCLSTISYAKMYKCTVDGKTTYSQTECAGDMAVFRSFDSDKFHQDTIQNSKLKEPLSIANIPQTELDKMYQKESDSIQLKIKGIDLGLNQSIEQLVKNKALKQQLENNLKYLKMDYLNRVDNSAESSQQDIMNKLGKLGAELNKIKGK